MRLLYLRRALRRILRRRPPDWSAHGAKAALADKLVALDPWKCRLCQMLCRSTGATRILEVGTSFGVSTLYLAAAVRENVAETGGPGLVTGTEWEPAKVAAARENLTRAGLDDVVDIREGDIRDTLKEIEGGIEFVLMDIWAPMARPALDLLAPKLKPGALLFCDNVVRFRRDYRDYLEQVRDPATGFMSTTLPGGGGVELSQWLPSRAPI